MSDDPVDVVRRGYDALSESYRGDHDAPAEYVGWAQDLVTDLPAGAVVLDVGCGNGVPMARDLAAAGLTVTGVDLSDVQIDRARRLVPGATFLRADVCELDLEVAAFDAVVALYSLIHVPLDRQPALLRAFARWLRPGGRLLVTVGDRAWTGTEDGWLGGEARMFWSHADAPTYRAWLAAAGFAVVEQRFVPDGDSGHALFRAVLSPAAAVGPPSTPTRRPH